METHCAVLTEQIEAGGAPLAAALAVLRGAVRSFAFDKAGCRVLQLALERARTEDAVELTKGLHGHVREAVVHPHANHVLQKMIQQVPPSSLHFIAEELAGEANAAVRHQYGCRIFCRLAEFDAHGPQGRGTQALFEEILASDVIRVCNHDYAHHVVNQIVEYGPPHLRSHIIRCLAAQGSDVVRCAKQRNASQILERGLRHGAEEDRDILAASLLASPTYTFVAMVCHMYGVHVVRALLALPPGHMADRALASLHRAAANARTRKDRYAQQVLREWGLMPS
jgi:mRNA-binding protein PUF3